MKNDDEPLVRQCPQCKKDIIYLNKNKYARKYNFKKANKMGYLCTTCTSKNNTKNIDGLRKRNKIRWDDEKFRNMMLKQNPMYNGKLKCGKNNPMYGKRVYDLWVEKYGKTIADQKDKTSREKRSIASRGKKNNMYGKPSPQGSGNGWSGWYKKWYFRSLRELSYMINVIEKNNYKWQSAETKKLTINYKDYKNDDRTYRADFLINDKILVEIKPTKLFNSVNIQLKQKAAEIFCKHNNLIYELVDPPILDSAVILTLYKNKSIVFSKNYDKLFKERYLI